MNVMNIMYKSDKHRSLTLPAHIDFANLAILQDVLVLFVCLSCSAFSHSQIDDLTDTRGSASQARHHIRYKSSHRQYVHP